MKNHTFLLNLTISALFFVFVFIAHSAVADDVRAVNTEAKREKAALIEKAAREKQMAQQRAAEIRAQILQDRTRLEKAVKAMQEQAISLETEIETLSAEQAEQTEEEELLTAELAETDQMIQELVGVIRVYAKDIKTLISESQQTTLDENSNKHVVQLADESTFPGMDGIHQLAETLFSQITTTGEVSLSVKDIIDRHGTTVEAEVLILGPFCAIYRLDKEIGFLRYSVGGQQLYALSKLPTNRAQKQLAQYFEGERDSLPMDITRGAALQQLSHSLSFWELIDQGGPIVWPILIIFALGIIIVVERIIFISRKRFNSDSFMYQIGKAAEQNQWDKCESTCDRYIKKPVARVIQAGINRRDLGREDMENVLQEAILREIPPLERFLSTLGMLAAISPLLGLLGTVTGMIATFHLITLHGTSDPRLMSGGISEALVTTMLGLGVAIPLMLAQTLLNRAVEKEIGTMEEKAVSLVNIIHKSKIEA